MRSLRSLTRFKSSSLLGGVGVEAVGFEIFWFFYFLIIRIFYNMMSATHKNISFLYYISVKKIVIVI